MARPDPRRSRWPRRSLVPKNGHERWSMPRQHAQPSGEKSLTDGGFDPVACRQAVGRVMSRGGRIAILVSRFNEPITQALLGAALHTLKRFGVPTRAVRVIWVPGAFELPVAAEAAAVSGRYSVIVALGCVIRGETPHFEYVAGEAARGLANVALAHRLPVGFGVLTTESLEQAQVRAGGAAGNKGYEAAEAALATAAVLAQLTRAAPRD